MKILKFKEHSELAPIEEAEISEELYNEINILRQQEGADSKFPKPTCLGLHKVSDRKLRADYYIGAGWLVKNKLAAVVEPKIGNIDFMSLFSSALSIDTEKEAAYFSHYYGINFNEPEIELEPGFAVHLTLLMITHYVSILNVLVKKGLKHGYQHQEENLRAKVKGRILFSKNLRRNQFTKREDRIFCAFDEYTADIPENRLLKKALLFAEKALNNYASLGQEAQNPFYNEIKRNIVKIKSNFEQVSDNIEIRDVRIVSSNKLFKSYKEAVTVAKALLRKYDYSFNKISKTQTRIYPFWIDMPRLYEMFVYSKLKEKFGDEVAFQVEGYGRGDYKTAADFILKKQGYILDAKYKPRYENNKSDVLPDIREVCGYSRDAKILANFDTSVQEKVIPCVIVYPGKSDVDEAVKNDLPDPQPDASDDSPENFDFVSDKNRFKPFSEFYFYKLSMPAKK